MVNVQEKLNLIRFKYDKETHIIIDKKKCSFCKGLPCLYVCPAGLFVLSNQEIMHTYEGCLECGTCYVACEQKAITWNYPSGGFGVSYREA